MAVTREEGVGIFDFERRAYERLVAIAKGSDPYPRGGILGGTGGVVRSVYLIGAEGDRPRELTVTPEEAQDLRRTVRAAGEEVMGLFSCRRTVSDDGTAFLPSNQRSGWGLVLLGDCPPPLIAAFVDLSPPIGSRSTHSRKEPVRVAVFADAHLPSPGSPRDTQIRILEDDPPPDAESPQTKSVHELDDVVRDELPPHDPGTHQTESVLLGRDIHTGEAVRLGIGERRQGLYVIGKTGAGKTTLLESLIVQDMEGGQGLCVLDPHGDLVDAVLARVPANRESEVILLDLADSHYPFGLNLFECQDLVDRNLVGRVATHAVEVFEKLWGDISWGPQLAQVLRNCAYTLIENPGYTMTEIRRLLLHDPFRSKLTADLSNPQVREFWELEYAPLRDREQQQLVRSTLNKVDEFLTPTVFPIVGFGRTTVDFREVMDKGQILLVRLAVGQVGARPVSLIGSMIVGQLFNAALSRQELPPSERRQFNLYADEYHRFATPAFAELLAEARKYALATTLAHQFRGQLTDEPNRGATLNAANLVVFAVHGEDGEELAKQFDRTPPPPDVAGQKPKLTISQDPIGHLVRSGHEDESVRRIVEGRLQPWVNLSKIMAPGDRRPGQTPLKDERYWFSGRVLASGLSLINSYLVELMEGRASLYQPSGVRLLSQIIEQLRGLIGFAPGPDTTRPSDFPEDTARALDEFLEWHLMGNLFKEEAAERRDVLVAARARVAAPTALYPSAADVAEQEVRSMEALVEWLYHLGAGLQAKPILVDSGQWEPYYDRPRSFSDVEAETASTLVGLPKYQARCRLLEGNRTVEHTVRTPEFRPVTISPETTAMMARIRDRTRADYCAPLATVLAVINERQKGDDATSTTVRRVPL